MTGEQIGGVVRALITFVSGYAVAKGIGDAAMWTAIAGGAATVAMALWSWHTNKPKA